MTGSVRATLTGAAAWDVFVPTNDTTPTHVALELIEPLDLSKIPNFAARGVIERVPERI